MTIDPSLIDVVLRDPSGYPAHLAAEDTRDALMCAAADASREFPSHLWIEPSRWAEVAEENDTNRTWPIDYLDRFTNQDPTHECTCHALRTCAEGCRARQRRIVLGPPVPLKLTSQPANTASVWLSPLSIYAEANPRQWGGASTRQVLEICVRRGFLPDRKQPRQYPREFRHTLHGTCGKGNVSQSSGPWVPLSQFPAGWQDTAKWFRAVEVIFPESWEQVVCCVLHGWFVGVGRSGHSIPYGQWLPREQVMAYPDSYDIVRYDSVAKIKSAVSGSYCITSMVAPDDWDYPAGE